MTTSALLGLQCGIPACIHYIVLEYYANTRKKGSQCTQPLAKGRLHVRMFLSLPELC